MIDLKVGAVYNLFDGEELLEKSINSIKNSVDYIGVVYQKISNFGNTTDVDLEKILIQLKDKDIIDEFIEYKPRKSIYANHNELIKRNIGLEMVRRNNCDYYMPIDTDEVYIHEQLEYAKKIIRDNDHDAAYCKLETYWRDNYVLRPREDYYVSLMFKIQANNSLELGIDQVVLVDPTRRMKSKNPIIFKEDEILMHHYSHIRKNYRKKLENSSALINFKDKVNELCDYYEKWKPGMDAYVAGLPPKKYKLEKI